MQPYTYELAANQEIRITSPGNLVACLDASAPFTVAPDGKYPVDWRQGLTLRFPMPFKGVVVANGATAQTITLLLGEGDANVPIPSVVEVVDGGATRSKDDEAFTGFITKNALASNYNGYQLWNPVDSGKLLVVNRVHLHPTGSSEVFMRVGMHNAKLPTAGGGHINSKLSGGGDSVAEIYNDQATSFTVAEGHFIYGDSASGDTNPIYFTEPFVVTEGWGMVAWCQSPNVQATVTFEFYEVTS